MYDVKITGLRQLPYVLKNGFQKAEIEIISKKRLSCWYKVQMAGLPAYIKPLAQIYLGRQKVQVLLKDTNGLVKPCETTSLVIELFNNEQCLGAPLGVFKTNKLERTRHWEFYYSQTMHTDLGYTDYQEDLRPLFSSFLDTVKQYMKNSDLRESDTQKYKYAIESGWVMGEGYNKQRNADEIQEIVDLINQERMTIGAGRFNYTTECFSTEETARATYYTNRFLVDKLGVSPSTTQRMFDNPAISKGYVDAAASAGIKYAMHSLNPDRSPYHKKKEYDLFYLEGMNPHNRLLIFNGKTYGENYGFGGGHSDPQYGGEKIAREELLKIIEKLEARKGRIAYPYDKFPLPLIPYGDNKQPMEMQIIVANEVNKFWEEEGYSYPRIKSAFPESFFENIENEYGDFIPIEKGTEENWWNDGWATTAFESGVNKTAGALVPVAETTSALASLIFSEKYPYEDLYNAMERNLTYDEHTWGFNSYTGDEMYHKQFEWKRSNAFAAKALSEKCLNFSLKALASKIHTDSAAIYVYNPLNIIRNDIVKINLPSEIPKMFKILDEGKSVAYTIENNQLIFVAEKVPAVGYKVFEILETQEKTDFSQTINRVYNCIENSFYKISFANDGSLSSILDKKNNYREIVDVTAKEKFNQYRYYNDFGIPFRNMGVRFNKFKCKLHTPKSRHSICNVVSTPIGITMELNTCTFRTRSIRQRVTLYNQLDRIDISNEIVKSALPSLTSKEEAFYTFPFLTASDYKIRYDLSAGNTTEGEQVLGTSTDWYTANKWVNVYDKTGDYSMTLALPDSALLQFGERRTGKWSFDYKSKKPYIYSYIINNMWQTNFQGDQPGYVNFNYSILTSRGEDLLKINQFAWEISTPLKATWILGQQAEARGLMQSSFIEISSENIHLSTIKASESNEDGMIIRLVEIAGKGEEGVTVKLPHNVTSFLETDIIENNIGSEQSGNIICFNIEAYGIKTFRIKTATQPAAIQNIHATFSNGEEKGKADGVLLEWDAVSDALYYEIFRINKSLESPKLLFLSATHLTRFFDTQVTQKNSQKYAYCVRSCSTGSKGKFSPPSEPAIKNSEIIYQMEKPILSAMAREKTRIDLWWTPIEDVGKLCFYEIWRDDVKIAQTENSYVTTYRDWSVVHGKTYVYKIKAVNSRAMTSESESVTVRHNDEFFNR